MLMLSYFFGSKTWYPGENPKKPWDIDLALSSRHLFGFPLFPPTHRLQGPGDLCDICGQDLTGVTVEEKGFGRLFGERKKGVGSWVQNSGWLHLVS